MIEIFWAIISLIISYIPFYFLSNRIFEKYKFSLSFGLFYISMIVIGFILQFFRIISIFPFILIILYIIAIKYGKYEKIDRKLILIFITIFILTSLPLFFVETIPIEGHDAAFHAYLTKLIIEKNSVYIDWGLMSDTPVNYSFGFHLLTAMIYFIGLSKIIDLVFVVPIFLFSIFVISIYPIARELGLNRNKSILAVIIAAYGSLFALFPVTWGGFAQLSGMVMLNFTFFFMLNYRKDSNRKNLLFYSLSSGILFLSHYWMFLLFGLALLSFWIVERKKEFVLKSLYGIILGFLFISPWIFRIMSNTIKFELGKTMLNPWWVTEVSFLDTILVLSPVILFLSFYTWKRKYLPFYLWIIISLVLTHYQYVGINLFNPSRFIYSLGIPLSILGSVGFYKFYNRFLSKVNFKTILILFICASLIFTESYFVYSNLIKHPPVPKSDYDTFFYIKTLPNETLIHSVGMTGTWIPFISNRRITTPMISSTETNQSFYEKQDKFRELYDNRNWKAFEDEGIDYIFISENEGDPPLDCETVYKRLFKCS